MAEPIIGKLKLKLFAVLVIVILTVCLFAYSRSSFQTGLPTISHSIVAQKTWLSTSKDTHSAPILHSTPSNGGFIVTMNYNSQMTRAIRNLMGQQCWARSMVGLSFSIAEPFSSESKLVHYRRFWDGMKKKRLHDAVLFGEYFDLDFYNKVSFDENSSQVTRWTDFLNTKAPRKLITVTLPSQKCDFDLVQHTEKLEKQVSPCLYGKNLNELISGLKDRFKLVSVKKVCLDCRKLKHKLSLKEFRDMLFGGDTDTSEYIVLMNTWRNFAFTKSWLEVPSYCKEAENPKSSKRLISSSSVANHSKLYKEKIIKHKKVVAVMFRIERFLTLKVLNKSNESLESCIEKTLKIHNKLVDEIGSTKAGTFITLDIGRFGSKLMKNNESVSKYGQDSLESINKSVQKMISTIYDGQFKSMEEYEDTFVDITGGITERGYISMVQRSIATEADCLIVMGGGSYQQVAISQYLNNHPSKQCIHAVCVADNVRVMIPSST